ncbi:MAG: sterol desaturase family protein [Nannocystaceae bacterium]|nr:sterol desaturase family protein [Nannocystaceae bacterium]
MDAVVRVVTFTVMAGLMFVPLEHLFGHSRGKRSGRLADLGFATVGELAVLAGLATIVGSGLTLLDGIATEDPLLLAIGNRPLRQVSEVAVGLLAFELVGYAYHRAAHKIPALWRLHAVHHSSESMDWLASFRQHPVEILAMTFAQNAPLVLLGLPLGSHVMVLLVLKLNTVFVHANIEIRPAWWTQLVATPRFHHRHHQREGATHNYAAMFPWLDRLFGTFCAERTAAVGVTETMPRSFVGLVLFPFFGRYTRA